MGIYLKQKEIMPKTLHWLPASLRIKPKPLTRGFVVLPDMASPYPPSQDCCEGHLSVPTSTGASKVRVRIEGLPW